MKVKYLVYPLSLFIFGQSVYYLIPPIVDLESLNPTLWWYDFYALIVFLLAYTIFALIIPIKSRLPVRKVIDYNDFIWYLIVVLTLVYSIRIFLWSKFGLLSMFHSYGYDGGLIDLIKGGAISILIPLLMYGWIVFKKKIFIIFFLLEAVFFLSSFSKVALLKLVIIYFIVGILLGHINKKILIRYLVLIFPIFIILSIFLTSLTHSYREMSVSGNATNETFLEVEAQSKSLNDVAFGLLKRLNLHKNHSILTGREKEAANLELIALEQIYLRLTFQSNKLTPPPYWGAEFQKSWSKTADVFPRNIILNEIGGVWLITMFAFLNAVYVILIKIISLNLIHRGLGISIYTSFALSYLMGDGGANPAVTIFNQIMFVITICLILVIANVPKFFELYIRKQYNILFK